MSQRVGAGPCSGLDVLHHLPDPAAFFTGGRPRARPREGRLALVEPWIKPAVVADLPLPARGGLLTQGGSLASVPRGDKASFDGDAALPWRIVRDARAEGDWRRFGLGTPRVTRLNAFAYLLSLGFRQASLLPIGLAGAVQRIDRLTRALAPLTALRAFLVWDTAS